MQGISQAENVEFRIADLENRVRDDQENAQARLKARPGVVV